METTNPEDTQSTVENANSNNAGLIVGGNADVGNWNNNVNKIINEPKIDIRIESPKSDTALQQQLSVIERLRTKLEGRKKTLVDFGERVECIKREKREYEYRVEKLKMDISSLESRLSDEIRRRGESEAESQKRCKELEAKVERKRAALDKQKENMQRLEREISALESRLSEEKNGKMRTEEDAQRQRENLEADVKNKRRALQKRKNEVDKLGKEVSTLDSKLSEEIDRREKLEAETQRERKELEASIKQRHQEFLDIRTQYEQTITAQKKEISSLGYKLSDEIHNITEFKKKVEREQQELKSTVEKERYAHLDMQKQNENLVAEHKEEISRLSAMLSEESSHRTASEAEALRVRQELEAAVEKERCAILELQEQKTACSKQDVEKMSALESKLSEEICRRTEIEEEAQRERQQLDAVTTIHIRLLAFLEMQKPQTTHLKASGKDLTFDTVAKAAEQGVKLIKFWTQFSSENPLVSVVDEGIQKHGTDYSFLIDKSIVTAEQGLEFSTEAIDLCKVLGDPNCDPHESQNYISSMRSSTSTVLSAAIQTKDSFKAIRKELSKVAKSVPKKVSSSLQEPNASHISNTEGFGLPASNTNLANRQIATAYISSLANSAEMFTNWWAKIIVALQDINYHSEALSGAGGFRVLGIEGRWEKISAEYKEYSGLKTRLR